MPEIFIGTAGWSYEDWYPVFYPEKQSKDFDNLKFYSKFFNCVEVNVTYYTYIQNHIVQGWVNKIGSADKFEFTLKLHQDFTHKRNFNNEKIKLFYSSIDILNKAGLLGGLLMQFPYSFAFNNVNLEYVIKLNEIFSGYTCFLEVRHASWMNKTAIDALTNANISLTTIDQPQIGQAVNFKVNLTSDTAYIRLHGRNTEAWKNSIQNFGKEQTYQQQSERYNYLYSPGELHEMTFRIREIYDKVKKVFVITNNHPKGNAVVNALELKTLLEKIKLLNLPENLVKTFPRLKLCS